MDGRIVAVAESDAWGAPPPPRIQVAISSYNRSHLLAGLLDRLAAQALDHDQFEVTIVDNGSDDGTWEVLTAAARSTSLRLRVGRLPENAGPAGGRNAALAIGRAPLVAFTDDDCLPTPVWLSAVVRALDAGADVVQAPTLPDPVGASDAGGWWHTQRIERLTGLFETCNVAYRREHLVAAGGFKEGDPLSHRPSGSAYGEDVLLGAKIAAMGANIVFCGEAVVHHRWLPARFVDHLQARAGLAGFPGLARRSPVLVERLFLWRVFLSRRSAAFDLALVGVAAAAGSRRRRWAAVLALPWARMAWREAGWRRGRPRLVRFAQVSVADAVGLLWLVRGSLRHGRVVL